MNYFDLKKYFDSNSQNMNYDFKLRLHRAISWGQASENENKLDEKLIKLWISFNALYGAGFTDFQDIKSFLESVIEVDKENTIKNILLNKTNMIKNFYSIPELYYVYWKNENGNRLERENKANVLVERNKAKYLEFIKTGQDTNEILFSLFDLIYLLRNQIFHGSASYNSIDNQSTKENCVEILELFIPVIIEIMINNPDNNWHEVKYKLIKNEKFVPQTKEERDLAIKAAGWLRKVDSDGECKTPPLSKENRRILYKILESKGNYTWEKYYPGKDVEGIIIRKK